MIARNTAFLAVFVLISGKVQAADPWTTENRVRSLEAYEKLYRVFQSPRCRNCHPSDDVPRQLDSGQLHSMGIKRRIVELGMSCQSCHQATNFDAPHMPPGAPNWQLAPSAMKIKKDVDPGDFCRQLKERASNGGRDGAKMIEHAEHEPLIQWAWDPGPGRASPEGTFAEFVFNTRAWIENGAFCP